MAQNAPPPPLPATGAWHVEYESAMCVLSRTYGTGRDAVTVAFRPWPMGERTEIILFQQGASHAPIKIGKGHVRLDPLGTDLAADYTLYNLPKKNVRVTTMTVKQAALAQLDATKTIVLTIDVKVPPVAVAPTNLKTALAALKTCEDDLLTSWGIDLATRQSIASAAEAKGDPTAWISSDDYPSSALSDAIGGTSTILWQITPEGRVTNCRVLASSGNLALDAAACQAITRNGHYTPARDKDGKPRSSYSSRNVVWRSP